MICFFFFMIYVYKISVRYFFRLQKKNLFGFLAISKIGIKLLMGPSIFHFKHMIVCRYDEMKSMFRPM